MWWEESQATSPVQPFTGHQRESEHLSSNCGRGAYEPPSHLGGCSEAGPAQTGVGYLCCCPTCQPAEPPGTGIRSEWVNLHWIRLKSQCSQDIGLCTNINPSFNKQYGNRKGLNVEWVAAALKFVFSKAELHSTAKKRCKQLNCTKLNDIKHWQRRFHLCL